MNDELKKEIILEHYSHPSNYEKIIDDSYVKINTNNESCIDNLNFYIKIEDNIIKDIKFEGEACAISMASSSIATDNLIGKTINDAINYINDFDNMMASVKRVNYTVQDIEDVIKHDIAVVREADSVPWETVDLYGLGTYTKFSCSYCPYLGSIEDKNTGFSGCKCTYDMGFRQSRGLKFNLREGIKKEDQNDSK